MPLVGGVPDTAIARLCQIGFGHCLSSPAQISIAARKTDSTSSSALIFDLFVVDLALRCVFHPEKSTLVATLLAVNTKNSSENSSLADDPEIEARAVLVALVDLAEAFAASKLRVLLEISQPDFPSFARVLLSVGFVVRSRTASLVPKSGFQLFTFRVLPPSSSSPRSSTVSDAQSPVAFGVYLSVEEK